MISIHFQGKPFSITVIQVYDPTTNAEKTEVEWFYEDIWDLPKQAPKKKKKKCHFQHRGLECQSKKSRDTWSNRQVWPCSTKWSREKANRVLPGEHTGHKNTLFQQHTRWPYTWTSPDGQYQNQIYYILLSWRWRSSTQLAKTRQGAVAQIMNSLLQNSDLN